MPDLNGNQPRLIPTFMERKGRRLFAIYRLPTRGVRPSGAVVFFAPFAEEMNRSRRMATLLGQAVTDLGHSFLLFDYSGTGDSAGAFADAEWNTWVDDGKAALEWMANESGAPVTVVGLRLGAAFALTAAQNIQGVVNHAVLWNPLVSGSVLLRQFLRIRLAASLFGKKETETTQSLRARLAAGETLEIGGYALNPRLAEAIEKFRLADITPKRFLRTDWMEICPGSEISMASKDTIARWNAAGVSVRQTAVEGDPFWSIQETTVAPTLIRATTECLMRTEQ